MLRRVTGEVDVEGKTVSPDRSRTPGRGTRPGPGAARGIEAGGRDNRLALGWDPTLYVEVSMETDDHSLEFAGRTRGRHRHVCAFLNGIDEHHR
jgi:hypothetical protein